MEPNEAAPWPALPTAICPGCGAIEATGFLGERTGAVVQADRARFADRAGFISCGSCGLVLDRLYTVPEEVPEVPERPTVRAEDHFGAGPPFLPRDATNAAFYVRLARAHARYAGRMDTRRLGRSAARVYDADALCTLLELPAQVHAAAVRHLVLFCERANIPDLVPARLHVREEAFVVSTVALVMERFGIEREDYFTKMVSAFPFRSGPRFITNEELGAAYNAAATWFGRHLWKDGPEDRPREGRA